MSPLMELLEQATGASKAAKEQSAKNSQRMMAPSLLVFRGDSQVAVVVAGTEGGADLIKAARMCIVGFAADVLVVAMDTYIATVTDNPRTGQPWERGEMQEAVEKYQALERGLVTDAVHVTVVNRAGDVVGDTFPYRKTSRHRVEWLPSPYSPMEVDGPIQAGGAIPAALRRAMNEPTLVTRMRTEGLNPEDFGIDDHDRMMAHQDLGVAEVLHNIGCTVAFSSVAGTVRDEVLKASANTKGI